MDRITECIIMGLMSSRRILIKISYLKTRTSRTPTPHENYYDFYQTYINIQITKIITVHAV